MRHLAFNDSDTDPDESCASRSARVEDLIDYAVRKITNGGNLDEAEYALNLCRSWQRRGLVVTPARVGLLLLGAEQCLAAAQPQPARDVQ